MIVETPQFRGRFQPPSRVLVVDHELPSSLVRIVRDEEVIQALPES
jgi:hypothetical protein